MSRLARFLALSPRRRRLLLAALGLSVLVRLGLALTSFRRTAGLMGRLPVVSGTRAPIADIRWAVVSASRYVPGAACLTRAVVAETLCRRYGHPADLHVGVNRTNDDFTAHSWLVSGDRVVVGDDVDLDRFEPLGVLDQHE